MKVAEILREAVEDFSKKYKSIYSGVAPDRQKYSITALGVFQRGIENGMIYNADYGESKDTLARAFEKSLDKLEEEIRKDDHDLSRLIYMNYDTKSYVSFNQAAKQVREYDKLLKDPKIREAASAANVKRLEELAEINKNAEDFFKNVLTPLKSKIVKGRKPNQNADPNAFRSTMGSKEAQELVKKHLLAGIGPKLDQFEKQLKDYFQTQVDELEKAGEIFIKEKGQQRDPFEMMILSRCFEYKQEGGHGPGGWKPKRYFDLKLTAEGKKWPEKEAKSFRDALQDKYFYKNLRKLSHLVDLKKNLDKIEELPSKPVHVVSGSGSVESGFKFLFADKSCFTVVNKIVSKYSYRGEPFQQFPTTFHDVAFPDGSKMKTPSEEKMVKDFGHWKPKDEAA